MHRNTVLILVIIALVISIFVSTIWLFLGSFFISGIIAGIREALVEEHVPLTFANFSPGLIIVIVQTIITTIALIIAIVKAIPSRLNNNLRKNGIWILVLGFIALFSNPLQFVSGILLITGGAIAIKQSYDNEKIQELREEAEL